MKVHCGAWGFPDSNVRKAGGRHLSISRGDIVEEGNDGKAVEQQRKIFKKGLGSAT
jgi:hypothetical protein